MPTTKDDDSEESSRRLKSAAIDEVVKLASAAVTATEDVKLNVIQFGLGGEAGGTSKTAKDDPKKRKRADTERGERPADASGPRIPDSVHERFIAIGNRFYFPDGQDAFAREGDRLTTRSENAIVIQSMLAIAKAESENGVVTVGGTDFFRKEAWYAGSLAGLDVKGYKPTEFERERLVRALAARRAPTAPADRSRESQPDPGGSKGPDAAPRAAESELIVGRLVDHGPAPYRHNPKEQASYFVRIETAQGDRDIWGADLERAFRHSLSTPGIGDEVGLRALGKETVTVLAPKRDADGREIGREELATHRNQWSVERTSFLEERRHVAEVFNDRSIRESEAIKRHPELEGSYLQLQSGQALANEQYTSQLHREQFVEHLRAYLAKNIEQGRPLEPVRLREREERTPEPRIADRDYDPTR